jgi:hypothetical protein
MFVSLIEVISFLNVVHGSNVAVFVSFMQIYFILFFSTHLHYLIPVHKEVWNSIHC